MRHDDALPTVGRLVELSELREPREERIYTHTSVRSG